MKSFAFVKSFFLSKIKSVHLSTKFKIIFSALVMIAVGNVAFTNCSPTKFTTRSVVENPTASAPQTIGCGPEVPQQCQSPNGIGFQYCDGNGVGQACTVTSCNPGFHLDNFSCVADACEPFTTATCSTSAGTGNKTCTAAGTGFSECILNSCNVGYFLQNGQCILNVESCVPNSNVTCGIANGTGSMTCNSTGSAYGSCAITSCNSGYNNVGGVCQKIYTYSWRTGGYGGIENLNLIGHLQWRPNTSFWCSKEDPNIANWPQRSVGQVSDSLCPQPKPTVRCIWTAYPNNDVIIYECH